MYNYNKQIVEWNLYITAIKRNPSTYISEYIANHSKQKKIEKNG